MNTENKLDSLVKSLDKTLDDYQQVVYLINNLLTTDSFKFVSKKNRNNILNNLIEKSADLQEISKITFRTLKKVKRERIQDDRIDHLLGVPGHLMETDQKTETEIDEDSEEQE